MSDISCLRPANESCFELKAKVKVCIRLTRIFSDAQSKDEATMLLTLKIEKPVGDIPLFSFTRETT